MLLRRAKVKIEKGALRLQDARPTTAMESAAALRTALRDALGTSTHRNLCSSPS